MEQVNNLFRSTHLSFLEEIALYKDRKIIGVYQRIKNKNHSAVRSKRSWVLRMFLLRYLMCILR